MDMLIRRLRHFADLTAADLAELAGVERKPVKYLRGEDIVEQGAPLNRAFVIRSGWAIRFQLFEDGRRQVLNILLPGDIFDLQVFVAEAADHSVQAVTDVELDEIAPRELARLFQSSSRLGLAFWWAQVQEEAILREQIIRNGRRTGLERVGHFLLELYRRALVVGEAAQAEDGGVGTFRLPLNQSVVADALGLTNVYVSKIMGRLARAELVTRTRDWVDIVDVARLAELAGFDSAYLHLGGFNKRLGQRWEQI